MMQQTKGNPSWVKGGPSPNPKGRPRTGHALSDAIRAVADPTKMAQIAWDIAQGKSSVFGQTEQGGWAAIVKPETRLAALNWLATNGFIKPPTQIETTRTDSKVVDFGRLNPAELQVFEQLLARASEEESDAVLTPALPAEE